jgi:hypothetical protein
MEQEQFITVEYGLGLTYSCDFNNVKPHVTLTVPVKMTSHELHDVEDELKNAIKVVKGLVDKVVHETLDQELELLLEHPPIYTDGPFYTLLRLHDPDTFFIVNDPHNIPQQWKRFEEYGFHKSRLDFLIHLCRVHFPNEPQLHSETSISQFIVSSHDLPTISTVAYVTIQDTMVIFPQSALPMSTEGYPEKDRSLPPIFDYVERPTMVEYPSGEYLVEHLKLIATQRGLKFFWCELPEDYKSLRKMFGDLEEKDIEDDEIPW